MQQHIFFTFSLFEGAKIRDKIYSKSEKEERLSKLKNELEKAKAEMVWGDDTPAKLMELLKELL